MASNFPGSLDSFNDPTASSKLNNPDHAVLHQDVNDAIEKVETKLGTGSATPSSGAVLVGNGAGTSTWDTSPNNLALDTPTLNTPDLNGTELILDADADTSITADTDDQIDIKVNGADDFQIVANNFKALGGSKLTTDRIDELTASSLVLYDVNGNEYVAFTRVASAVNLIGITNAATGNNPQIAATGDDTNISLKLVGKGNGGVLPEVSGCGLTHSTTQSIASATIQAVVFDTEAFDTASYHSTSSNTSRITVPVAGKYQFNANVAFASNNTGLRFTWFGKNGVTTGRYGAVSSAATQGDVTFHNISYTFNLAANDYIEVFVFQSSGGALNLNGDATNAGATSFEVVRAGS